jgi:hypothetical protein
MGKSIRKVKKEYKTLMHMQDLAYQHGNIEKAEAIDKKVDALKHTHGYQIFSKKSDEKFIRRMNK